MRPTSCVIVAPLCAAAIVAACTSAPQATPVPNQAGLPNPASVFCEEQGGRLEIRTDLSGGQVGICVFADGSECDEWAFMRGECQPGSIATQVAVPTSAPVTEPAATPPAGWEVYTHPTLGYSFSYPAGSTLESSDIEQYSLVVGPLEGDDHWPWFNVSHPDREDDHPPADVDLQAWLAERSRLPGKVMGTRAIAGESAIHTRFDDPRGPQPNTYSDDRYYFVHDGQLYEITIMHTGKEDWAIYDQFLDSFQF
jgi:putative hemolysin